MTEFDLIARHFSRPAPSARLGVGDDAALLKPTPGMELAVSTDTLLSGRHFLPDTDPRRLGRKCLAVNLSDLAAMGALPRWALLALTLPEADADWLAAFAEGFYAQADEHGVGLVGGDTTRGPLSITVTILGEVEAGRALTRHGARPGDDIWVSGELGGAALGLCHLRGEVELGPAAPECLARLHDPVPRIALGRALLGVASAALDVSDGLLGDLGHILERSGVGARAEFAALPLAAPLRDLPELAAPCGLAGGDDYELCFTAPPERREAVLAAGRGVGVAVTRIGAITQAPGLAVVDGRGRLVDIGARPYDHFG